MKKKGFTIIELLTVISIIAIIIGILAPGIKKAKIIAMNLQQKSQLRSIGIGLEIWSHNNDQIYPDSTSSQLGPDGYVTTGAHHLAESLMGRDGNGYDFKSSWDANLDETSNAYSSVAPYSDRQPIYVEKEDIRMFQLAQVYGIASGGTTGDAYPGDFDEQANAIADRNPAGIITDVFRKRKIQMPISGERVKSGSPILYFKAKNTEKFDASIPFSSVFNWNDNNSIFALGHNMDNSIIHPYDDINEFYDPKGLIVNKNVRITDGYPVPHNSNTFLLMSAGADGLYGTKDDIMNISSN